MGKLLHLFISILQVTVFLPQRDGQFYLGCPRKCYAELSLKGSALSDLLEAVVLTTSDGVPIIACLCLFFTATVCSQ